LPINRATFLNALMALHQVGDFKEIPEDAFDSLFTVMGLSSDEAVTHINECQKDGLVHLRWRGWVTLTEKGHAAAEGRGTATYAVPAAFRDEGEADAVHLDVLAGHLFATIQFISGGFDAYEATDKARAAVASLALAVTAEEVDKAEVAVKVATLKTALAALPLETPVPLAIVTARKAAASIAAWAGAAWA
jgi:hypothetical protein